MPLEGHWRRQNTPLRSLSGRERRLLVPLALALVIACVVIVYLAVSGGSSKSAAPGCVDVVGPSTMGAANYHACGRQAAHFCAAQANRDDHFAEAAQEACRKAGV